jgi:hypothetical protein
LPLLKRKPDLDDQYSTNPLPSAENSFDELDALLADIDLNGDNIEGPEEVIESMTADDLDDPSALPECPKEPAPEFTELSKAAEPEFTELSETDSAVDNPVNESHYVSVFRDAKTMRQIRALHENPDFAGDATLLVTKPLFSHTSPYNPWWHENERPDLPTPARQYRSPAPWRDTSDYLKVTFRHIAMKLLGSVYTLNLNLSPEVEAKALSQAYPIGWLHRRTSHHLREALGRPVEFHLVAEQDDDGRLHLHGEFQIADTEATIARGALRKAGGKWDAAASNKQAWTQAEPDAGWLNYITGDLWRIGYTRNFLPRYGSPRSGYAITFKGGPTSSTKLLNQKAAEIYEAHRQLVKMNKI